MCTNGRIALYFLTALLLAGASAALAMAEPPATQPQAQVLEAAHAVEFPAAQDTSQIQAAAYVPSPYVWAGGTLVVLLIITSLMAVGLKAQVRRQTRHLQESEARLNTILDSVDACIYIKDAKLRYAYGNRQLCERFGRSPQDLIGTTDSVYIPADLLTQIRSADLRVLQLGQRVVCEEKVPRPDGEGLSTFLSIKIPLRAADGTIEALCGISTDITELQETRETVERLAHYDALTELPNRRLLQQRIEEAMLVQQGVGSIAAVLFIDLDKFKNINDERGHDVGDAVLRSVAQRLTYVVRREDVVARLGGDEFVVLLHDLGATAAQAAARALQVAETVRRALAQAVNVGDQSYYTGGSIGVALLDPDTKTVADVLREADTAMYHSKERGRNRVALFQPWMHAQVSERAALLRDLVTALGTGQFQLLIQPQCDAQRRVVGAEMLLRWEHPTRGSIMPDKFIGLAEESGVILDIGYWALEQACLLHRQLADAGRACPVSVNVSAIQLRHPDFQARVKAILESAGAPGSALILELTESVLIDDVEETARRMQALADLGVRFSIDDFGTGYSGLAYLHRLPLYELKIAESFIREIPDKDAATLVRLIVGTARLLELRVVAEGVERRQQAEFLEGLGCDALQGFFYHRPMTLADWVAQRCNDPTEYGPHPSAVSSSIMTTKPIIKPPVAHDS